MNKRLGFIAACFLLAVLPAAGETSVEKGVLIVPKIQSPPRIDGVLDDQEWAGASSFIALLDGDKPAESLAYPPSNVRFAFDDRNLYLGFDAHFPRLAKIIKGRARTDSEPEVWPDESFEFYVALGKDLYRFAGNVAGGFAESRNGDNAFNGRWQYKSTLRMQIDDSELWQGEIAIPFTTLGLAAPIDGQSLKVNFCRTWRIFDRTGTTSLAGAPTYDNVAKFAQITFSKTAAVQDLRHSNPNSGIFKQDLRIVSPAPAKFSYRVVLASTNGTTAPETLFEKTVSVTPNQPATLTIDSPIGKSDFDTLQFTVRDETNARVMMAQAIPFTIAGDFLAVKPAFSNRVIWVEPKLSLLKDRVGTAAQFVVTLTDAAGKIVGQKGLTSDQPATLNFDRKNPAGMYTASLLSTRNGKRTVHTQKEFYYPGIGDYEKPQYDPATILPPFTPIKTNGKTNAVSIEMWGRQYRWQNNLLPAAITSGGKQLLSGPAQLCVDGQPVPAAKLSLTRSSPARCELSGTATAAKYTASMNSWVEYDGVLWNTLTVRARRGLKGIGLRLAMPAELAPYLHAARDGFGAGGGYTGNTATNRDLDFCPVVWLGGPDKGLAWFAETAATWRTSKGKPIRVFAENGRIVLDVTFADALAAGSTIEVTFGLIATPVKPLPANYPLNTFGAGFALHLNQKPPRAPVTYTTICMSDERALRMGFFDLPLASAEHKDMAELKAAVALAHRHNAKCIPYLDPDCIPDEYPVAVAFREEWQMVPQTRLDYQAADGRKHDLIWCCPASMATNYYLRRMKDVIRESGVDGLYFDFGLIRWCSNTLHGCHGRYPLLAMREFYRGIADALVQAGKKDYIVVVHNSQAIQVPVFTFVTNLFNGEHFRQMSSDTFHNGKDILDSLTINDFATEFSSLPWGITSSTYMPTEGLRPQFGGGKEPTEPYVFRMGKAFLAGSLVHNSIPGLEYAHFGLFDKLTRIYDAFGVPEATFVPYWNNGGAWTVTKGRDIYVSAYRHHSKPQWLLIVSHISKRHDDQEVTVALDPQKLGLRSIVSAQEMFTQDDPEYKRLLPETNRMRIPITLGNFGVAFKGLDQDHIHLSLKHHSVAIIRVNGE